MALPCSIKDREYLKFTIDDDGEVCVRVCGEFAPKGLNDQGLITEVTLNSATWTPLPASALLNRNGVGVQNDTSNNIKINFDNTVVGFVGWKIAKNGELFMDVRDNIIIYAKSQSGTPTVTIMEIA
jgi:hypothetical protein